MTTVPRAVEMISVNRIHVLNPRSRNKIIFQSIISNISNLGLKRPITVAHRQHSNDGKDYQLICGQGRLEAYIALGQSEIPAIVAEASTEDCYLMSLVENIARRKHSPLELMREIRSLRSRGYSNLEIAKKIDLDISYVRGVAHLLDNGEERLLAAVERGRVPLSVAIKIADADEAGIQAALCQAYEDKTLRGSKLQIVRRVVEQRKSQGKRLTRGPRRKSEAPSAETLVRVYRQEADKQRLLLKKAQLTESRLLFIVSAIKKLFEDEDFVTLLRAEKLDTLPAYLAKRIRSGDKD